MILEGNARSHSWCWLARTRGREQEHRLVALVCAHDVLEGLRCGSGATFGDEQARIGARLSEIGHERFLDMFMVGQPNTITITLGAE